MEFSNASQDNPQPTKTPCFNCGSDQCFMEKLNKVDTLMCFSCGFMTSETYKKTNLAQNDLLPSLSKCLMYL